MHKGGKERKKKGRGKENIRIRSKWGVSCSGNSTGEWFFTGVQSCSSFALEHNLAANNIIQNSAYWLKLRFLSGNTSLLEQSVMEEPWTSGDWLLSAAQFLLDGWMWVHLCRFWDSGCDDGEKPQWFQDEGWFLIETRAWFASLIHVAWDIAVIWGRSDIVKKNPLRPVVVNLISIYQTDFLSAVLVHTQTVPQFHTTHWFGVFSVFKWKKWSIDKNEINCTEAAEELLTAGKHSNITVWLTCLAARIVSLSALYKTVQ